MKFVENECCELKSILSKDIKKEIIAFANTNGGTSMIKSKERIIIYNIGLLRGVSSI